MILSYLIFFHTFKHFVWGLVADVAAPRQDATWSCCLTAMQFSRWNLAMRSWELAPACGSLSLRGGWLWMALWWWISMALWWRYDSWWSYVSLIMLVLWSFLLMFWHPNIIEASGDRAVWVSLPTGGWILPKSRPGGKSMDRSVII